MFLKEKRDDRIKGQTCVDGRKQRAYIKIICYITNHIPGRYYDDLTQIYVQRNRHSHHRHTEVVPTYGTICVYNNYTKRATGRTFGEYRSEATLGIFCDRKRCEYILCEVTKIFIWIMTMRYFILPENCSRLEI